MNRALEGMPSGRCYAPQCNSHKENKAVLLLPEEVAVLDLIDMKGLDQEKAAVLLGVSRKTIWRDIHDARHKIADAILNGKEIRMYGCIRMFKEDCPKNGSIHCPTMVVNPGRVAVSPMNAGMVRADNQPESEVLPAGFSPFWPGILQTIPV
jgi:predicted DNA-binding protein (UPF0251 family)